MVRISKHIGPGFRAAIKKGNKVQEKMKKGIRWLIFFYVFVIFQHFSMRAAVKFNPAIEAIYLGTLMYLVYGFLLRKQAARWVGIGFHAVFQVMEMVSIVYFTRPEAIAALIKEIPGATVNVIHGSMVVVFLLVTLINISAIVYLFRNKSFFTEGGQQVEETGPFTPTE
jgi:hypothetical protein